MKNLSISILKKKIFLRDLLRRMKDMPNAGIEGNLIDEILLNSEFIDYDTNDMSEEKYDALVKLYKKIKNTDLMNLYNNLFDGKPISIHGEYAEKPEQNRRTYFQSGSATGLSEKGCHS